MHKVSSPKIPALLFSALVLVLLFSACSKGKHESQLYSGYAESPSTDDNITSENKPTEGDAWIEYFYKYFDSSKRSEVVNKAMDLLTAKCMKDKGFDYKIEKKEDSNQISTFPFQNRLVGDPDWGTTDIEYAKIYGYLPQDIAFMFYENMPGVGGANPNWAKAPQEEQDRFDIAKKQEAIRSRINPEYIKAYSGDNGCSNTGETDFYNGLNVDASRSDQIGELRIKIKEMAADDPLFAPKLKEWSECMSPKGFSLDFLPGARYTKGKQIEAANPAYGPDNSLLAVADAECKQQTGFIDAWHKVLDEVEERELKNNLPIFEEEKAYTDSMINRANEIIEKYGNEFK
ncbi:MAG: hypothetical protein LBI63_05150 [Candidatus Ancillula sp.]|jgi:hypothetical protein|nr:hypothetical protein [Candidatus Ancillula sp.]